MTKEQIIFLVGLSLIISALFFLLFTFFVQFVEYKKSIEENERNKIYLKDFYK